MGGFGSGAGCHSWRPAKKTTGEECPQLDANRLMWEELLKADLHVLGHWQWTYRGGRKCSIGYRVDTRAEAQPVVWLTYQWTGCGQAAEDLNSAVRLTTTRLVSGSRRWWFVCPLVRGGRGCGRRAGELYLPPGARYFGCRQCHALTYTSCQESGK